MTTPAKNLTASIEDGFLVIKVPLNPKPTRSSTGKTLVVASSHGNKHTELQIDGKPVIVGVNAYGGARLITAGNDHRLNDHQASEALANALCLLL